MFPRPPACRRLPLNDARLHATALSQDEARDLMLRLKSVAWRTAELKIHSAKEPHDIELKFIESSRCSKRLRRMASSCVGIVVLLGTAVLIYICKVLENSHVHLEGAVQEESAKLGLQIGYSICVSLLNILLKWVLIFLAGFEHHSSKTGALPWSAILTGSSCTS